MNSSEVQISRKEREIAQRKQDILNTAARLFSERDFHEVTVEDIATEVGLSKGTLYLYFKNKDELFFSIIQDRFERLYKRIKEVVQCEGPFEPCVRKFIQTYIAFFDEHRAFFKIIQSEKTRLSMEDTFKMQDYFKKIMTMYFATVNSFIRKGQKEGAIRPLNPRAVTKMLIGTIHTFTFDRLIFGSDSDLEAEEALVMDMIWNGIRAA